MLGVFVISLVKKVLRLFYFIFGKDHTIILFELNK